VVVNESDRSNAYFPNSKQYEIYICDSSCKDFHVPIYIWTGNLNAFLLRCFVPKKLLGLFFKKKCIFKGN